MFADKLIDEIIAPPTNQSTFHQWTIGPIYYSAIVLAEAFGRTGNAQIIDLQANTAAPLTPAYAIYENGVPSRVALFNYVTDPSGQSEINVGVQIPGGTVPQNVKVKYLASPSVSSKGNITWAGQVSWNVLEKSLRELTFLFLQ